MPTSRQALKEVRRGLRTTIGEIYPILAFYGLYAVVVEFYQAHPFETLPSDLGKWSMLLTSPFNYFEVVGKTPAETTQGLFNNFLFPATLMILAMLYNIILSHRLRKYVSVPSIFGASVIGTYLASDFVWKITPYPATGTSIIGFAFAVALAATAFADLIEYRQVAGPTRLNAKTSLKIVASALFAAFALVTIFNSYLLMNPSALLHLAGGGISLMFLYIWSEMGRPSVLKLPGALGSSDSRSILFILGVVLVVLLA